MIEAQQEMMGTTDLWAFETGIACRGYGTRDGAACAREIDRSGNQERPRGKGHSTP